MDPRRYPAIALGITCLNAVLREVRLSWRFIWRDLSTTMVPALLFMLAALKTRWPVTLADLTEVFFRWLVYFWLYIYTFCLSDQITGIEEDRYNKPDRPIPMGEVSRQGALWRFWILTLAFFLVGVWFGVWPWTLMWIVATILHNFFGFDKHWFTKNNVVMFFGVLAEVGAAWQLVAPLSTTAWKWLILTSFAVSATAPIQDFRDVSGDVATGRKTLPIVLGQRPAKLLMCVVMVCMMVLIYMVLIPLRIGKELCCGLLLGGMALRVVIRLLSCTTPQEDHKTYMLYTYWYCILLFSAIVVIQSGE